jgi:transcriptional regulator with XRE-family HTH domain
MSFKSWRGRMRLSQERVADASGLSLRTVQRLEAGHRVSYASLRALAGAFETDVDQLERELYAVNDSKADFVEIPRWIRVLPDRRWFGGPGLSRRDMIVVEVFCLACAIVAFAVSFVVAKDGAAAIARLAALPLAGSYAAAVSIRTLDKYALWPGAANAPEEKPRTWRTVTAEYSFMLGLGAASTATILWLMS